MAHAVQQHTVPAAPKGKTKAKTRYLKAKKERKKKRKAQASTQSAKPKPKPVLSSAANTEDEDDEDVPGREDEKSKSVVVEQAVHESGHRKKRRRLSSSEASSEAQEDDVSDIAEAEPAHAPAQARAKTPEAALPSFPPPVAPDAPSKSQLAVQGLDKAILNAEIVGPARTLAIDALTRPDGELPVLSERMKKRLAELGITELFAVQTALLPFLLPPERRHRALYCPYDPPRDVCASAPTGSGKTLAYVIPIVEILTSRISTKLRALVVLPTRDLVLQVQETFEAIARGRGLKIGVATGQHSFTHEQNQLIADQSRRLQGGSSKVDILICTPGRLIDHLNGTPNFTLQHLRFLVIDEADRLLAQSFQDWLAQVLSATRPPPRTAPSPPTTTTTRATDDLVLQHDALAPAWLHALDTLPDIQTDLDERKESSCQKLLFSATLTRDPSKIAAIGLRDAKYFIVQGSEGVEEEDVPVVAEEKFAMPQTLREHMLVCETSQKPLMLFHLVHSRGVTNALVFTKSAESTARLVHLFDFFEQSWCAAGRDRHPRVIYAYSSDLSVPERKAILERFKTQEIDILVCSDLISRGIDISHVSHVVSYDAPVDMRKYVHRVGRTARAGREGDAWTLVEDQEARYFKTVMREANHLKQIKKLKVSENDIADLVPHYEVALGKLREVYSRS